jgi:RNA polymerase sigma-70 factor (ECF subfamily)
MLVSQENPGTLEEIVVPFLGDLYRVALDLSKSRTEAEELVSETIVRACEKFSTLRDRSKAKQWLLRILTNVFMSRCRSKRTKNEQSYEDGSNGEHPFSLFDQLSQPFFWWGNPEREVINRFLDDDLKQALGTLGEESRTVVVMCDVEGYSYEEIASVMNIPIGTVRSKLSRARSELQKRLYDHALDMGWVPPKNKNGIRSL